MSAAIKFGGLPLRQTAFFMCDMQEKFRPAIRHFNEILGSVKRLVKLSKILEVPLLASEQYPATLGHTAQEIPLDHAVGVFPKNTFSACTPEVVKELEKMKDLKCIVLFGIAAHVCVDHTATDFMARGLTVHLVADACSAVKEDDRIIAFERLQQMGCFITTTENVIFKLLQDKNHPKFKEIQPLIREVTPYTGLCNMKL